MKTTYLLVLGLFATMLSGIGASSLANRVDPTARSCRSTLLAGDPTLPCMSCDFKEV